MEKLLKTMCITEEWSTSRSSHGASLRGPDAVCRIGGGRELQGLVSQVHARLPARAVHACVLVRSRDVCGDRGTNENSRALWTCVRCALMVAEDDVPA